jgi:hypothetical protein
MQPAERVSLKRYFVGGVNFLSIALIALGNFMFMTNMIGIPIVNDFTKFYGSYIKFISGADIYSFLYTDFFMLPNNGKSIASFGLSWIEHPNLNSPLSIILFSPLGWLDYKEAAWVWFLVSLAFCLVSAALVARLAVPRERFLRFFGFVLLVLLTHYSSMLNLALGQNGFMLLMIVMLGFWFWHRDADLPAGVFFGIALYLKPFTGLFLIVFLLARRWRLAAVYVGTFLVCLLVGVALIGVEAHVRYVTILGGIDWHAHHMNASWMGLMAKLFGGAINSFNPIVDRPDLAYGLGYGGALAALVCFFCLAWRGCNSRAGQEMALAFAIPMMLLISPLGWIYYMGLLLVPLMTVFRISSVFDSRFALRFFAVLAWVLSVPPFVFLSIWVPAESTFGRLWDVLYSASLLLMAAVMLALFRRHRLREAQGAAADPMTAPRQA